jgi:electron transfer flavoprotein alpha subunit
MSQKGADMSVFIVGANGRAVAQLAASLNGEEAVAVVVGPAEAAAEAAASPVAEVRWIEPEEATPPEAYAPAVAEAVAGAAPRVVVADNSPEGRTLAGACAVALGAAVVPGATSWQADDAVTRLSAPRHGGIVEETVEVTGPVVVIRDASGDTSAGPPAPVAQIPATPIPVEISGETVPEVEAVDLAAAKVVVGVGRGLKAEADLAIIEALARSWHGEVGCTRPLAEGVTWLSKSRYIGMSGLTIAPALYVAVGISGQLQHMAGVRGATRIVAVNTDPEAPVFNEADYGIVGDLYTIVPALTEAEAWG